MPELVSDPAAATKLLNFVLGSSEQALPLLAVEQHTQLVFSSSLDTRHTVQLHLATLALDKPNRPLVNLLATGFACSLASRAVEQHTQLVLSHSFATRHVLHVHFCFVVESVVSKVLLTKLVDVDGRGVEQQAHVLLVESF